MITKITGSHFDLGGTSVFRIVFAIGLLFTCVASAQPPLAYLAGHVTLDEAATRALRLQALEHTRVGHIPPRIILFPEVPVEIRVVCDGKTVALGETHLFLNLGSPKIPLAEGVYHFRLDTRAPQSNVLHSFTRAGLVGCTVGAFLPGFRSDLATIAAGKPADVNVTMHRAAESTGFLFSPTLWAAPQEARGLVNDASEKLRAARIDTERATADLRRALEIHPHYAQAWTLLAAIQETTDTAAARASYRQAIAADPSYLFPYQPSMRLETRQGAWQDVFDTATQLLQLCPHDDPEAWYDLAFAAVQLHRDAEAERSARRGLTEDGDRTVPELERLLGSILLAKGDRAAASEHFQNYLTGYAAAPDTAFVMRQLSLIAGPAAGTVPAPSGSSIAEMVALVRAELKTADEPAARRLRNVKLAERLDDRSIETLESEGAGPLTAAELRRLRDQSLRRPPSAVPAIASASVPSAVEQASVWAAATANSLHYNDSLPNFICTEMVRRYQEPEPKPYDTLEMRLTYFKRKESYQLISVNGKTSHLPDEQPGGVTSKGEFGSALSAIFAPGSHTEWHWDHWTTLARRPTHVYYFRIGVASSVYKLESRNREGGPVLAAWVAQQGYVYVDAETDRVLRISWQADDIPLNFEVQTASTRLDYGFADIGADRYLLPIAAEIRMASPGEEHCNEVVFREYRRFTADSNITFEAGKR